MNKEVTTKSANLSLANRKQLADMLGSGTNSLRQRAKSAYANRHRIVRQHCIDEYAKEQKVGPLLAEIEEIKAKLDARETVLAAKGLEIDDGKFDTNYRTPDSVKEFIENGVHAKIGTEGDIDKRFDEAQVKLMTIGTLDEARELIESLLKNEPFLK